MLEKQFAIQIALQRGTVYLELDLVPCSQLEWNVLRAAFDKRSFAIVECPEDEIVLGAVEPDREVVAVRLDVEQNSRATIEHTANHLELHGDRSVREFRNVPGDRDREVGERVDVVDELLVSRAV